MSDFVEQLRLAEKAAEDIYFGKINHELIEALHRQMEAENAASKSDDQGGVDAQSRDRKVKHG